MDIAFVDLRRQYSAHKKEIDRAIDSVLVSSSFIEGHFVKAFEKQFATFCNKKFCVSLNSGTDALHFALLSYGIGSGDEVITAPNSYFSSAMVISNIGAVPVFVDVNAQTGLLETRALEKAVTKKTKAIMPVHLTGLPVDMNTIVKIAKFYKLRIIEDCAQAHGATINGKILPLTSTGAFSFYPAKNLGAYGDGGALVTNDPKIADTVRHLRNDGSVDKYIHTMFGYKSRLDGLQAAILSVKLKHLDSWTKKRRILAHLYTRLLSKIPEIITPAEIPYGEGVYHLYQVQAERRDKLKEYLKKRGVNTVVHYPIPIHLQKPYRAQGFHAGMFPIAEKRAKKILSLPMFPELAESEIRYISRTIRSFYG